MLQEVCEKRQCHTRTLRKHDRDRLINEHRLKFFDMSDLLNQTESISSNSSWQHEPTAEERMALLIYGSHPNKLVEEADDGLHAMMVQSESAVLGEKCKCTSVLIALFKQEGFELSNCAVWLVLRTLVNLVLRAPKIDYELCAALLQAITSKMRRNLALGEPECSALLKCLEEIPATKRTQIFTQHRRLLEFVVDLLLMQNNPAFANRFVAYVDTVFSGCDEDSRDILLQNLNLIKVLCQSLGSSPSTVDSVLMALSNIALNGSDMVDFLNSVGLVPALMSIFQHAKPSTKHLVVVVFYNLILSSSDEQIIYLCRHGLMYLIEYCMVQPINLESLQLSLKILEKLIIFISKRYQPQPDQLDPRTMLRNKISHQLKRLHIHQDEFVRELTTRIQEALGCPIMEVE